MCGHCAVVCGDFGGFFKVPLCVKLCPCTGEIEFSRKNPCTGDFPCAGEIGFSRKIPVLGIFKKLPCWKRLVFSENSPIGKIISLCVGTVLWCVNTLSFFKVPWCVGFMLCVGTLKIFKIPLCVGSVLWCGDFENLQSSPVCVGSVVCGDFENFQSSPVCVGSVLWCVGTLSFSKFPFV